METWTSHPVEEELVRVIGDTDMRLLLIFLLISCTPVESENRQMVFGFYSGDTIIKIQETLKDLGILYTISGVDESNCQQAKICTIEGLEYDSYKSILFTFFQGQLAEVVVYPNGGDKGFSDCKEAGVMGKDNKVLETTGVDAYGSNYCRWADETYKAKLDEFISTYN